MPGLASAVDQNNEFAPLTVSIGFLDQGQLARQSFKFSLAFSRVMRRIPMPISACRISSGFPDLLLICIMRTSDVAFSERSRIQIADFAVVSKINNWKPLVNNQKSHSRGGPGWQQNRTESCNILTSPHQNIPPLLLVTALFMFRREATSNKIKYWQDRVMPSIPHSLHLAWSDLTADHEKCSKGQRDRRCFLLSAGK